MKINILGDSHVAALGPRLKKLLSADDVWFDAYPGFSTAKLMSTLEAQAEFEGTKPRPADLTIVVLGGNDFGDRELARAHMLEYLAEIGAGKILWVGPAYSKDTAVDARHRMQAESQANQFELLGVPWLDSYPATQHDHAADGVHFTSHGYDTWAEHIAEVVRKQSRSVWPLIAWAAVLGVVGGIFYRTLKLGKRR